MVKLDRAMKVAISSSVGTAFGVGSITAVLFALFMVPMTKEWGWTRTQYTTIGAVAPIVVVLSVSWLGRMMDRYGTRTVVVPGKLFFSLAIMLMALAQPSYAVMGALWVVFGVTAATQGPGGYTKALSVLFHRNRGFVMALSLGLGGAVGGVIIPLIVGNVIQGYGWRTGYIALGMLPLLFAFPLLFAWFRPNEPLITAAESAVVTEKGDGMHASIARRTRPFWLIFIAVTLHNFAIGAMLAHAVPLFTDRGFTIAQGGTLMAIMMVARGACGFLCGYLLDRINSPRIALPFFLMVAIGAIMINFTHTMPMAIASMIVLGAGMGGEGTVTGYLTSRYFGMRSLAEIFSNFYTVQILAGAFSPIVLAMTFDILGSYTAGVTALTVALVIGAIFIALLPAYVYRVDGSREGDEPAQPQAAA